MGIREDEKIAPHCEFIHVHDKVVKRVMDVMPEGEELQNLAEFFRVFGDSTRIRILYALSQSELCVCKSSRNGTVCDLPPASDPEADAPCQVPQGRKERSLLSCGRSHPDDPRTGDGAYRRENMKFTKMQGIGNDYVYVNCFEETVEDPCGTAKMVSDRHFGIGSDGLILIKPSRVADCQMDMYNLDGSRGAMCGNGIRCVGKYAYDHGIVDKTEIDVETASGIKHLSMKLKDGKVELVTVDMGRPVQTSEIGEPITVDGKEYRFTGVSMGNPHAVVFMDGIKDMEIEQIGPSFEVHEKFPDRTNTEFVEIVDRGHVNMRVWERGSGETLACGTGACATAVACILNGLTDGEIRVTLLGGDLLIRWDREKDTVFMTGPAAEVFHGEI